MADAGEVKSSRDAASETEGQIDLICVHTNGEHQRMIGNYNTTTRQIAVRVGAFSASSYIPSPYRAPVSHDELQT